MLFYILFVLFAISTSEEIYENSICTKCQCTYSSDSRIFVMNCVNKNLHHVLSSWPAANSTTISAAFAGNNITTLATLPPTDAILEVSFVNCNIQFLYPGVFSDTKNIKVADFSHNLLTSEEITSNKLVGPYKDAKTEPVKLEILNLAYNQIHTLNKDVFDYLPDLKVLNLEGNDFKVLDVHTQLALSSLTGLASLNLANNELTELAREAIEGFKHLTELDLSKNQLDFVPSELSIVGETLEVLILDDNPIVELEALTFLDLPNLIELSINNLTKLEKIPAKSLSPLSNLKILSLSNNTHLKTINKGAFAPNLNLLELYLNNNNLTIIDYTLLDWSKLHIFQFKENPLYCNCDLYNISTALSRQITIDTDGPRCYDLRTGRAVLVYELSSDICLNNGGIAAMAVNRGHKLRRHFSMPLAGLVAVLILAAFVALTLIYHRYRRFLRNRDTPFASQVFYNPLSTTGGRL